LDAAYLFAEQFAQFKYDRLPAEVAEAVKKQILDFIGVALGGACQPEPTRSGRLAEEMGRRAPEHGLRDGDEAARAERGIGQRDSGHCLDFDDVHEEAVMHPGVITIPTAFAMADYVGGLSGKELIAAVALAAT
jgi:2-methylcitrate dehydratase PrpD